MLLELLKQIRNYIIFVVLLLKDKHSLSQFDHKIYTYNFNQRQNFIKKMFLIKTHVCAV